MAEIVDQVKIFKPFVAIKFKKKTKKLWQIERMIQHQTYVNCARSSVLVENCLLTHYKILPIELCKSNFVAEL